MHRNCTQAKTGVSPFLKEVRAGRLRQSAVLDILLFVPPKKTRPFLMTVLMTPAGSTHRHQNSIDYAPEKGHSEATSRAGHLNPRTCDYRSVRRGGFLSPFTPLPRSAKPQISLSSVPSSSTSSTKPAYNSQHTPHPIPVLIPLRWDFSSCETRG